MPRQLDILAIEPFHGGQRRAMLDAIARFSRHRWKILTLPPRNMQRRLQVSAIWFAEHLARNRVGRVDLLFATEALNLADFLRLRPQMGKRPAVVYFHENQLPPVDGDRRESATDLVNLNSATAATEIWFNSLFHLRTFLSRASALVSRHAELQMRNPMSGLMAKAHLVAPPMDLSPLRDAVMDLPPRNPRAILIDTRQADHPLLAHALRMLSDRQESLQLTLIGQINGLPDDIRLTILPECDSAAHVKALQQAGLFICARPDAMIDDLTLHALASGCHPIVPGTGVFPDLLPEAMHDRSLYDTTAQSLVTQILDAIYLDPLRGMEFLIDELLSQYDAIEACKLIDERIDGLASTPSHRPTSTARSTVAMA